MADSNLVEETFPFVIGSELTPHVADKIFGYLEYDAMTSSTYWSKRRKVSYWSKCRKVSQAWRDHIDRRTDFWGYVTAEKYFDMAKAGRLDICRQIIEKASNKNPKTRDPDDFDIDEPLFINRYNYFGKTPLHAAAEEGHLEIYNLIFESLKNGESDDSKDDICSDDSCLEGEEINPFDSNFETPMHLAAKAGHLDIIRVMVDNLEDLSPQIILTPLHEAALAGHLEICRLIIERVKDKNPEALPDSEPGPYNFRTPLHFAAKAGHLEICKLIMSYLEEKDKHPRDRYGDTPFDMAAAKGHLDVCRFILENVEDKNPVNPSNSSKDETTLHVAAANGRLEICRLIIQNVSNKNPKGLATKSYFYLIFW